MWRRPQWCCQSNANRSPLLANEQVFGYKKVPPLAKRSGLAGSMAGSMAGADKLDATISK